MYVHLHLYRKINIWRNHFTNNIFKMQWVELLTLRKELISVLNVRMKLMQHLSLKNRLKIECKWGLEIDIYNKNRDISRHISCTGLIRIHPKFAGRLYSKLTLYRKMWWDKWFVLLYHGRLNESSSPWPSFTAKTIRDT